jgi:hypothetical protein
MLFGFFVMIQQKIPVQVYAFFSAFLYHLEIFEYMLEWLFDTEKYQYAPVLLIVLPHLENQFSQFPVRT